MIIILITFVVILKTLMKMSFDNKNDDVDNNFYVSDDDKDDNNDDFDDNPYNHYNHYNDNVNNNTNDG